MQTAGRSTHLFCAWRDGGFAHHMLAGRKHIPRIASVCFAHAVWMAAICSALSCCGSSTRSSVTWKMLLCFAAPPVRQARKSAQCGAARKILLLMQVLAGLS